MFPQLLERIMECRVMEIRFDDRKLDEPRHETYISIKANHEFLLTCWSIFCVLPNPPLLLAMQLFNPRYCWHARKIPCLLIIATHLGAHAEVDVGIIPLSATILMSN